MHTEMEAPMARIDRAARRRQVFKRMPSPVGTLTLVATDDGLAAILWEDDPPGRVRLSLSAEEPDHPVLLEAERQLTEYFAGRRTRFALAGGRAGTPVSPPAPGAPPAAS